MSVLIRFVLAALVVLGFWLTSGPALAAEWRDVTDDRLLNAGSDGANWLMYNRTYSGWRFSPLEQINTGNVKKLVPKWIFAGGTLGDQQTTPIVNDGIMFTTSTAPGCQPGAGHQRRHRRAPVEARSEDSRGRRRARAPHSSQSRRRAFERQGDLRHPGRVSRRPRGQDGEAGMGDEDRRLRRRLLRVAGPHGREGQGDRRDLGAGRDGPPWIRRGLRRGNRQEPVALVLDPRGRGARERDVDGRHVEDRRRRRLACRHLRSRHESPLYFGTGNPAPWIADMRRGDNLYTMSAVALDLDSGKLKWYHQYLANEPWDFDTVSEHHVIDVV